ncbi:hypothetical protein AVEN_31004-1, partial [Araneus ventricosus]
SSMRNSIFQRIKQLEDRILFLEGISPDYFHLSGPNYSSANKKSISEKEKVYSNWNVDDIQKRIQSLKESLKLKSGRLPPQLPVLQPAGMKPKLKKKKYEYLMELLQFVPPIFHQFCIGLPRNSATEATTEVVGEGGESEAENVYDADTDD